MTFAHLTIAPGPTSLWPQLNSRNLALVFLPASVRIRKIDTWEAFGIQGYRGLSAALELGGPTGAGALAVRQFMLFD